MSHDWQVFFGVGSIATLGLLFAVIVLQLVVIERIAEVIAKLDGLHDDQLDVGVAVSNLHDDVILLLAQNEDEDIDDYDLDLEDEDEEDLDSIVVFPDDDDEDDEELALSDVQVQAGFKRL